MDLKVKKLRPDAKLPNRAHEGDAGLDLYYCGDNEIHLYGNSWRVFPTGIVVEIPCGFVGEIRPRSGLAAGFGVTVLNSPGTIDAGYRGEIIVLLTKVSTGYCAITPGDKIAQLVIVPVALPDVVEVSELGETERGAGGFGSTGK